MRKFASKFYNFPFFWQKFLSCLLLAAVFVGLYTIVGHFYLGVPCKLPLTPVDNCLPLLNWTFWIYVSDYVFIAMVALMMPDHAHFFRLRKAFFALIFFHFAFFFLCPTISPRPQTIVGNDISAQLGRWIHAVDAATNCFPSLHVSLTYLTAFAISKTYKVIMIPSLLWATAIAISTMTTKQHYFYDVIGGTATALLFFFIFYSRPVPTAQAHTVQST